MKISVKHILVLFLVVLAACNNDKRYIAKTNTSVVVLSDSLNAMEDIKRFQDKLNEDYADEKSSPLLKEDLEHFEGLDFFKIDTTYRVKAVFEKVLDADMFYMKTTTDRTPVYKVFGILTFKLHGETYTLNVYQSQELKLNPKYKDYLFVPFLDETNGEDTYGGGRYIDASIPEGNTMLLDFNKAYNPYCAYNKKYSCPIVPAENTLPIAIRAGVKKFK